MRSRIGLSRPVLGILLRISRIRMFLGLPDPEVRVRICLQILHFSHKDVERTEIMLKKGVRSGIGSRSRESDPLIRIRTKMSQISYIARDCYEFHLLSNPREGLCDLPELNYHHGSDSLDFFFWLPLDLGSCCDFGKPWMFHYN
jgi:hypothetical protein